jgi:hypothetical protein
VTDGTRRLDGQAIQFGTSRISLIANASDFGPNQNKFPGSPNIRRLYLVNILRYENSDYYHGWYCDLQSFCHNNGEPRSNRNGRPG